MSRKDFVGRVLDLPAEERLEGSLAATAVAAWLGATVFRAHDVRATRRVVDMVATIRGDRPPRLALRGTPRDDGRRTLAERRKCRRSDGPTVGILLGSSRLQLQFLAVEQVPVIRNGDGFLFRRRRVRPFRVESRRQLGMREVRHPTR